MPNSFVSNPSSTPAPSTPFVIRVLNADSTKKGAAAAVAGLLVAVVSEALWPSS